MVKDWTQIVKKYGGQWVAFKDDEITVTGHGKTLKAAIKNSISNGYKDPIVMAMPKRVVDFVG